jgi:DNA-binding HxlR family transcriptional regulator
MRSYGQYCPIARTSELFAERWTPILIRNLLAGCRTFGELMEGAPGISKALLAQRLELLEDHGIIVKETGEHGRSRCLYSLTEKGRELKAITDAMGEWGAKWLELEPHHLDAGYVLWATCKLVDPDRLPAAGLIVRVELSDEPKRRFWMVLRRPRPEVCSSYLGWPEDLVVRSDGETLARWHLRHVSFAEAATTGRLAIEGPPAKAKAFVRAIRPSPFAEFRPGGTAAISL